ncbi:MAG: VOC family protein [Chloroflexi bacterium]|nr:VOC family protein [Chloroflexota bacterium]
MTPSHEQPTVLTNRSMPPGVVIVELAYPDVREAVGWLCRAFGFVERLRIGNHRCQLSFGQGAVIVTRLPDNQSAPPPEISDPRLSAAGALNHAVMVRVADVNSHFERARQAGAQIVSVPTDFPYGERQYTVDDPGGHRWTFSQAIADVDPHDWGGVLLE